MEVGATRDPHGVWGGTSAGTYVIPHGVSPGEQFCLWIYGTVRGGKGRVGKMGWGWRREGLESGFWVGAGVWGSEAVLCKMPPCRPWGPGKANSV